MTTGRGVLVALILTATVAFVVGVVLERHETHKEAAETPAQRAAETPAQRSAESTTSRTTAEPAQSGESAESGKSGEHKDSGESGKGSGEGAEHNESGESATHEENTKTNATTTTAGSPTTTGSPTPETTRRSEASEKLLGVNPESTGLLAVAVVASLLLAAGVWGLGASPLVLGVVALAMAAFGALDVREVIHQANESRTGLVLLAALVAVLHFAAALLAARAAVGARDTGPPAASSHATS